MQQSLMERNEAYGIPEELALPSSSSYTLIALLAPVETT